MKISTLTFIRFLKLAALLLLCAIFTAPRAQAQAIKMLPPTNCPFVTQAQINAGASNTWGVLAWDSKNPLSCVPNFQFSDNGYTGIGSAGAQPQALLDLFGDYDYSYPTPGASHLGNVHMDPTDNTAPTNDGWGTAITFGGDNGYDASAEAGIYVQYSSGFGIGTSSPGGTKMYFGTTNNYATGAQIQMMIDQSGNVGVGTTAPQATLDVNGTLRASASYVAGTACTLKGLIAYDYTNNMPVYCNGTEWGSVFQSACTYSQSYQATKIACGMTSQISCSGNQVAVSGGGWGVSNDALQNSGPIVNTNNSPTGWLISIVDTADGGCTGNAYTANGTVANGSAPSTPPRFPITGSYMAGAAWVICCL